MEPVPVSCCQHGSSIRRSQPRSTANNRNNKVTRT
jgi:hypothetical protein